MIRFVQPPRLEAAGRVAPAFDLVVVELVSIAARQRVRLPDAKDDDFSTRFEDDVVAETATKDAVSALVSLRVRSGKKGAENSGCFDLDVSVRVVFKKMVQNEIPAADVAEFLSLNGLFAAWPYLRELASSTVTRMGFPPFTLDPLVIRPEVPKDLPAAKAKAAPKS